MKCKCGREEVIEGADFCKLCLHEGVEKHTKELKELSELN